jgi:hypothetical protein
MDNNRGDERGSPGFKIGPWITLGIYVAFFLLIFILMARLFLGCEPMPLG